jgi:hypothetical protein
MELLLISIAPPSNLDNPFNMIPPCWHIYFILKEFNPAVNFPSMAIIIIFAGRDWFTKSGVKSYVFP